MTTKTYGEGQNLTSGHPWPL